jgi:hypothetical protein
MATHRPHDMASAPDFDFQVALGVLEVSEDLAARRRPLTPDILARQLCARSFPARPTLAQIERGLAQVQHWRDQILTRDLLHHRGQLVALGSPLRAKRRQLDEDRFYLDKMLRETEALLENTLIDPGEEEPLPAVPASARRTLPERTALRARQLA